MSLQLPLACLLAPLAALALLALPGSGGARAGEDYYLLVFAAQRVPNSPNYSHTFATFVRSSWPGNGSCPQWPVLESCTISWLPRNLVLRTLAFLPECGRNLGLHETLRYVLANEERVSLWGPYRIDAELYRRARRQVALLESGSVLYKANDLGYYSDDVCNCIHAVQSLADGYRLRFCSPGWGETASYRVLEDLLPWVLDREHVHPWVGCALGLCRYPILYRGLEPPRGGVWWRPLDWLPGREDEPPRILAGYGR
jgi:hypothetical protein